MGQKPSKHTQKDISVLNLKLLNILKYVCVEEMADICMRANLERYTSISHLKIHLINNMRSRIIFARTLSSDIFLAVYLNGYWQHSTVKLYYSEMDKLVV